MRLRLRRAFFVLHLWLGLGLGLYMVLLGLTGAILVWKAPLERALYPQLYVAAPTSGLASLSQFMESVSAARPEALINRIHLPEEPGNTVEVRFTQGEETHFAYLDPQSAQLRGIVAATGTFTGWLLELHLSLLLQNGRLLNTIGAIGGIIVLFSGVWLWWPSLRRFGSDLKQRITVKRGANLRRLMHDLHNVFGIYSVALLLLSFFTGAVILELHEPVRKLVYRLTNTPDAVEPATLSLSNETPKNLNALLQAANTALPGTKTTHVFPPKKLGAAFRTVAKDLDSSRTSGIAQIFVDPATGRVVQVLDQRQPNRGEKIMALMSQLHYAEIGGWMVRVLYSLAGLMPLLLFMTGLWKWNEKRRARAKNRARRQDIHKAIGTAS